MKTGHPPSTVEQDEDYYGIDYADNLHDPSLIKVHDPWNLGVVCGFSEHSPLPVRTLSTIPPVDLTPSEIKRRRCRRLVGG